MAETLPPIPMAFSPTLSEEPRVRRIKFGDGYEYRVTDGLNPISMTIAVSWKNRSHQEAAVLIDFFRRHGGHAWFYHVPHGEGVPKKFVCPKWSSSRSDNSSILKPKFDIVAELYQVHDLT